MPGLADLFRTPERWAVDLPTYAAREILRTGFAPWLNEDENGNERMIDARIVATVQVRGFLGKSGLRLACPDCGRMIERRECRLHGRTGYHSAVRVAKAKCLVDVKFVHDDGKSGAAPWLWNDCPGIETLAALHIEGDALQSLTREDVKSLEALARVCMSLDASADQVERKLIAQIFNVRALLVPIPPGEVDDRGGYALIATEIVHGRTV